MISVGVAMGIFILEILKSKLKITTTLVWSEHWWSSCNNGPQAIRYGSDKCAHCQMTLIDQQFGENRNRKGKHLSLMTSDVWLTISKRRDLIKKGFLYYVVNFETGRLIPVEELFMKYDDKTSPYGIQSGAFWYLTRHLFRTQTRNPYLSTLEAIVNTLSMTKLCSSWFFICTYSYLPTHDVYREVWMCILSWGLWAIGNVQRWRYDQLMKGVYKERTSVY